MRCLYCGNPLSVLQKVKDSDFCSAEHRSQFHSEQQRMMTDRLKKAALRIKVKASAPKVAPPAAAAPAQAEAPAPPAPYVLRHPEARDCSTPLMSLGPLEGISLVVAPPPLVVAAFSDARLPGLVPELPWPRYNPGLWSFDVFLPEYGGEQLAALVEVMAAWSPFRAGAFGANAGLLHLRRPDPIAPLRTARAHEVAWLWFESARVAGRARLRTAIGRKTNALPLVALAGDPVPAVVVPPYETRAIVPEPLVQSPALFLPEVVARGAAQRLAAIERIFRMRPRGAVGDPVAAPLKIHAEPLGPQAAACVGVRGARPASTESAHAIAEPRRLDQPFRMRPRSGVNDSRLAGLAASSIEALSATARPNAPNASISGCTPCDSTSFLSGRETGAVNDPQICLMDPLAAEQTAFGIGPSCPSAPAQAGSLQPQTVDRAFRMRPRSGVADSRMADLAGLGIEAQTVSLAPEAPHARINDCSPAALPRFFRSRVRGPLDAATAGSLNTPAHAADIPSAAHMPRTSAGAGTLEPQVLDRAFRMRPRSGVIDPRLTDLTGLSIEAEAVELKPQCPHAELGDCAPRVMPRFFRTRVSAAVIDDGLQASEPVPARAAEFAASPSSPTSPAQAPMLAPPPMERAFRMRPRSGVADTRILGLAGSGVDAVAVTLRPKAPGAEIAECTPRTLPRFFRPRPAGAAADNSLSAFEVVPADSAPFSATPSVPAAPVEHTALAPCPCERAFRMRPRAGVADTRIADLAGSGVDAQPVTLHPQTPQFAIGDCAPAAVARFFRPRPRGPAADPGLTPLVTISCEAGSSTAAPVICCTVRVELRDCVPATANRFFRPKPRGPLPDLALSEMQPIPTGWTDATEPQGTERPAPAGSLAARACPALSAAAVTLEPLPFSRFFRMRPRTALDFALKAREAEPQTEDFRTTPASPPIAIAECVPVAFERLYRARPSSGVASSLRYTLIVPTSSGLPAEPAYATFRSGALGVLSPEFLNRLYRMRPRTPLEDEATQAKDIRCRQVPVTEPDPVIASMPGGEKERGLSLINRLYKFRPRGARESAPEPKPIPCEAVPGAGAEAGPSGTRPSEHHILHTISRHWKILPLDLKAMALLIPIVFIIAFQPGAPKEGSVAAAGVRVETPAQVQTAVGTRVSGVERGIRARAAVDLREDFQSGLHRWNGPDGWGSSWKYHTSGAIMPGTLALFQPSLTLSDYKLEFSAQIVEKGFGWAVRAVNDKNFYGIRLVTESAGPLPKLFLERWAVVDGVEMDRVRIPLPITIARDTIYRIALEVRDQYFTLMIQGQVVDFWSDAKLKVGGIGFFTAKGEQALVQALRITHQYDLVGRVVAAFFRR